MLQYGTIHRYFSNVVPDCSLWLYAYLFIVTPPPKMWQICPYIISDPPNLFFKETSQLGGRVLTIVHIYDTSRYLYMIGKERYLYLISVSIVPSAWSWSPMKPTVHTFPPIMLLFTVLKATTSYTEWKEAKTRKWHCESNLWPLAQMVAH